MNQGYLFRRVTANRSQSLHRSDEALVMSVEQREAGRQMGEDHTEGKKPTPVENIPKPVGETKAQQRAWVEPTVWTERMLTALGNGVKGGRWYSLMDKVHSQGNLHASWARVRANGGAAGVDRQSISAFQTNAERHLDELKERLKGNRYTAQSVKRVWIPKPGSPEKRPLGIPVVKDRIVQAALRNVIEPIYENIFAEHSYGFRPGRGCKDALRRVNELLKTGSTWVVDADIKSYFDSIPHDKLMREVEEQVADGKVLELIAGYLKQGIMDGLTEWAPDKGTPQGAVISPLLANIYLNKVDHAMRAKRYEMVRYADDFVILCRSEAEAQETLAAVKDMIEERGLTLHPEKTRIVNAAVRGGFDFLGYHFERGMRWPRKKSVAKLKDTLRQKTMRKSGVDMTTIIKDVNASLRGWFEYFKHSHKTAFPWIDGWVRMRLRSILRKRLKRKGRGRGADHQRWPNAYFIAQGLFTLKTAYELARQSH